MTQKYIVASVIYKRFQSLCLPSPLSDCNALHGMLAVAGLLALRSIIYQTEYSTESTTVISEYNFINFSHAVIKINISASTSC